MILIAYDGTPDADHAIAAAGALLHGGRARVVHVWQVLSRVDDASAILGVAAIAGGAIDAELARQENRANHVVERGVQRARSAGFEAEGAAIRADGSPAVALEAEIDRLQPELVVIGSRGLTGLKAWLQGSVSHHVSAYAHAPVMVVPPQPVAG
jgi:nucleotide-binding universal stress UspA family protein